MDLSYNPFVCLHPESICFKQIIRFDLVFRCKGNRKNCFYTRIRSLSSEIFGVFTCLYSTLALFVCQYTNATNHPHHNYAQYPNAIVRYSLSVRKSRVHDQYAIFYTSNSNYSIVIFFVDDYTHMDTIFAQKYGISSSSIYRLSGLLSAEQYGNMSGTKEATA